MSTVQPVSYQPYQQNIIVNQPRMQRDWSTGLCGCFEDIMSCLAVTFCGVFYSCYLPMKADESCCLCCGMPNGAWAIALRTKIRAENAIQPYKRQQNVGSVRQRAYGMKRQWSTGLFGCCEDVMNCCVVTFCGICYAIYLPTKANESCCLCCCLPQGAWLVALRTKIRTENKIEGTICNDCCHVNCCGPCAMCQLSREIDNINSGMV